MEEEVAPAIGEVDTDSSSGESTLPVGPPLTHSLASGAKSGEFPFPPLIAEFRAEWMPPPFKPGDYNADLATPSFFPINMTWGGEQRKGIQFNIPDAVAHMDHAAREMLDRPHLPGKAPLPRELSPALEFLRSTLRRPSYCFGREGLGGWGSFARTASRLRRCGLRPRQRAFLIHRPWPSPL